MILSLITKYNVIKTSKETHLTFFINYKIREN